MRPSCSDCASDGLRTVISTILLSPGNDYFLISKAWEKENNSWYPDRESNSELSFRRALLYPFNYQGMCFSGAKVRRKDEKNKRIERFSVFFAIFAQKLRTNKPTYS